MGFLKTEPETVGNDMTSEAIFRLMIDLIIAFSRYAWPVVAIKEVNRDQVYVCTILD